MKILTKQLIIIIVGILAINSCSKDENENNIEDNPCKDEIIGEYHLFENSRNCIPYDQDLLLYFKDSQTKQVVFEAKMKHGQYPQVLYTEVTQCEFDNSEEKKYLAKGEGVSYSIEEPLKSLGISFDLALLNCFLSTDNFQVFDELTIKMDYSIENNNSHRNISALINSSQLTDDQIESYSQPIIINEITILNKTFHDVYSDSNEKVFYNFEVGLVAFRDNTDNFWVFEKVENLK